MKVVIAASTALALVATTVVPAHAFCGFFVSGSNKKMFNDATNVVLMRSGTRTVLSMQNDYRGPLEDFAMVVPVPVVLKEGDVRVIPKPVIDRIDSLGSPRLVEYWEQDPCPPDVDPRMYKYEAKKKMSRQMAVADSVSAAEPAPPPTTKGAGRAEPMYVAPILASFAVHPPSITANHATPMTWSFHYSNQPYPEPVCTVDHGVGRVQNGVPSNLTLKESADIKITCANAAGRSTKTARVNVVTIEAKYNVAEYQILILSAKEATGLENWLDLNNYKIPTDAAPLLRPYVEGGSKFFVAKVDPKKVQMVDGRASLSPLRFHYDSEEFSLPIRLGMANSSGKQDLIVSILSPDKRFEVANYKNVMIPTNFDVKKSVRDRFPEFYAALFDKTIEANPGAVITEYAWKAVGREVEVGQYGVTCDPCPTEVPIDGDMMQLGADTIGGPIQKGNYVLTRLHARYGKADMKDDLRFREAKAITGGREMWSKQGLEYGATPAPDGQNFFQARYAMRNWWTGPIKCKNPRRGVWGGPPHGGNNQVIAASKTAFAPRGKLQLASVIKRDLWEIGYKKAPVAAPPKPPPAPTAPKTMWFGGGAFAGLLLVGLGAALARRRSRSEIEKGPST